ncbi:MAG TPA: hypothetical protein VEB41_06775 [Burkholderiales bacterium]|nr:hypothetical protein [Burkholderiales bacterium]
MKLITRLVWTILVLVLLIAALAAGTVYLGIQGYRAFTREDLAAFLYVKPTGPQRFEATVRFPDGKEAKYDLAGDEVYVDARIIKWKPAANVLGLHTAYELDRIAGRYRAIDDERAKPRTVHELGRTKAVDLFALRKRFEFLGEAFDAEYGSGTFVPANRPAALELRVSTTGLLIRDRGQAPN